jgi:tetratricopeptide (TPR) repeat protein
MPESICLHIQDRESGPIRVVEIPWISVRIGCAAYCEVRLADLALAEEACRLQRRGRTWHLVPLGPKGSILVQDRPIEGPYPLPFDVPFRIGSICFTLRQNRSSDPDWEMYRTLSSAQHRRPMSINPLPVSLPAVERCIASIAPPRSQRDIVHESSIPLAPRIESPLERSTSPRPVNPWEARWKAAGARLQAERKQPLPPGRPHPSPPADRYQSVPLKEPSVPLSRKAEPAVSPSRSREFSTHPLTPAAAPGYPVPPSISARSRLDANLPIKAPTQPAEPSIATVRLEKITTRDRQPASLLQTGDQGSQLDRPDHACPEIRIERADLAPERSELEAGIEPTGDVGMVQSTEAEKPGIESIAEEGAEDGVWVAQPVQRFVADTSWTGTISFLEMGSPDVIVSTSTEASECLEAGESDREERASIPNLRTATLPDPGTPPAGGRRRASENEVWSKDSRHKPGIEPEIPRPKTGPDLPSAKDILAAVSMRPSALSGKPSTRMNEDQGKPTERREPGQWFPHLWLVWPPTALLVIGMGIVGSLLSLQWSGDSFNASVVSQRLLPRSENPGREKPLPESVVPPESSWWQTTPLHLAEWGVYLGRSRTDDDRTEEGRELVEAAVRISPINPMARLARAQLASKSSKFASRALDLGLSRDAVSLAWSARVLRHAGKRESAIRVYRQALRIACGNDLAPASKPTFNDEPNVRRYLLPGETTARAIVRELITDADWTFQDWSEALPKNTVAILAAARLLRERERPEAQALLKQILNQEQEIVSTGAERAVQTATIAEAHALLSQWREAEQQYHQAIDRISDLTIKRSWWFNLASVALQLNDEAQRKVALEAALEAPTSDDISRRALELQRASEPLGRLRSSGTKAN